VQDVAQAAGTQLPRTRGWWIFGRGRNPESFAYDLQLQPRAIVKTGQVALNTGGCQ